MNWASCGWSTSVWLLFCPLWSGFQKDSVKGCEFRRPILTLNAECLRNTVRWTIVGITSAISVLCFIKPSLNAFALMTFSIPGSIVIYHEGVRNNQADTEKFICKLWMLKVLKYPFKGEFSLCGHWQYHFGSRTEHSVCSGFIWVSYIDSSLIRLV